MHRNPVGSLVQALRDLAGDDPVAGPLAAVLADACSRTVISYDSILATAGPDAEDLVFVAWQWKLLIPRRSAACGEWDHRLLVTAPGELYEMPNISRYLVKKAMHSGSWETSAAVADMYRDMGEPCWDRMPELIRRLGRQAENLVVSAAGIHAACCNAGFYGRTGAMILTLKGGGIISPKLAAMPVVAKSRSPAYELNPGLYPPYRQDHQTL